ncbi:MAG TPA: thioredoxin family protein [Myxococcota bacterium]|jgi:predicted dithiol-disulfide oxidoreductase (DUF899 family)|nr:thioredoxin family protein [Myxococcota bacterium]
MTEHRIVSRDEWLVARKQHLAREKELTRLRDELARERRELPWVRVEKEYVFEGPEGKRALSDLFQGRSQLVVYHFMLGPGWKEGCVGCSFTADHFEGPLLHLAQRDVTLVAVSRAPIAEIEAFRKRMGWRFPWVSSFGSDFNYDYHVSFTKGEIAKGEVYYNYEVRGLGSEELPGVSVFHKDTTGDVFHTYSCYARGGETLLGAYALLDIVPKGRGEAGPSRDMSDWLRHHDRYDQGLAIG